MLTKTSKNQQNPNCLSILCSKIYFPKGANTGIGRETALDCARRGARVFLACRDMTARERVLAQRNRRADIAEYLDAMDRLDAVILPSAPSTAIPLSEVDENNYTVSLYTRPGNYLDLAALSVPVGLSPGGLPTSLQIMVRRFDDPLALRIGRAFEEVRGAFPMPPTAG